MSRRSFLKFAGASVLAGVAGGDVSTPVGETLHTEVTAEDIPSEEGIRRTFDILRGERSCRERRKHGDEHGAYLWELEFKLADGGTAEFGYMRKGKYPIGGSAIATKIYVTFFDESGMPEGGHDVAEYREGEWVVTDLGALR